MFADVVLTRRVERAEAELTASVARAVARRHPGDGAFAEPVGGGVAAYCRRGSPMNKMIGLGLGPQVALADLARVERRFADLGVPLQAEVSALADPALWSTLTGRGYVLEGFEFMLGAAVGRRGAGATSSSVDVRVAGPEDAARWMDIVATGFEHPDVSPTGVTGEIVPRAALEQAFVDFAEAGGLRRYLAFVDGEPAGGASLRLEGGVAQLCGAATLPAFRRRGVQTALLHARLDDAAAQRCDVVVVTTAPGSMSQANVQRQGLALLYPRAILVRQPA